MSGSLRVKLIRDLRRHWPQFVAVFLMATLSVLIYTGLEGAWNGLRTQLTSLADETDLADAWLGTTGADQALVDTVGTVPGVRHAEAATVLDARATSGEGTAQLQVELLPATPGLLSRPVLVAGQAIDPTADGIWLAEPYADAHDIAPGQTITLDRGTTTGSVDVLGVYLSSEKIYYTGTPALVAPAPDTYGYALLPEHLAASTLGAGAEANLVRVAVDGTGTLSPAIQTALADAAGDRLVRLTDRESNDAVSTAFDRVDQIRNLSLLFSFIFVVLAVLAMYTSTRRLVDMQTREIALLKALGFPARSIGAHFASYGLVAGGAGALLGLAIAPLMSMYVLGTQQSMLSVPTWRIGYTAVPLGVVTLVVSVCVLGAYLAARPALRGAPADQLRPGLAQGRRIAIERLTGLWRRIGYGARWAWRDSLTNRTRFVMGVIAVAGSLMLLFAGFGMADSMHGQVRSAFVEENSYAARASLAPGTDPAALLDIAPGAQLAQETVVRTEPTDGFDRVLTILDDGDHVRLTTVAGTPADLAVPAVTEATADRLGLTVGDTVHVTLPAGAGDVTVTIGQIIHGSAPQGIVLGRSAWESLGAEFTPTTLLLGADAPLDTIESTAGVTDLLELETQRNNATGMVKDLGGIFMLIRVFAILLSVIVLYSLGSLAFTERLRDYATLKVLGFDTRDLRGLASRENIAATVLGLLLGVPAGLWFLGEYVGTFSTPRLEYTPQISALSVVVAATVATVFSMLTTVLLGRRIRHVDMVGALKGVE